MRETDEEKQKRIEKAKKDGLKMKSFLAKVYMILTGASLNDEEEEKK